MSIYCKANESDFEITIVIPKDIIGWEEIASFQSNESLKWKTYKVGFPFRRKNLASLEFRRKPLDFSNDRMAFEILQGGRGLASSR
jgi:hypothetical protein